MTYISPIQMLDAEMRDRLAAKNVEIDRLRAERDAMREALEPFVKAWTEMPLADIRHSRDDYRKARAALNPPD